jgi:hypothetical protein
VVSSFYLFIYWDPYKKQEKTRIFNCSFCALKESGELRWDELLCALWIEGMSISDLRHAGLICYYVIRTKNLKKKKEKAPLFCGGVPLMLLCFLAGHLTEPILESPCTLKISNLACNLEQHFFIFFRILKSD